MSEKKCCFDTLKWHLLYDEKKGAKVTIKMRKNE